VQKGFRLLGSPGFLLWKACPGFLAFMGNFYCGLKTSRASATRIGVADALGF
jgi:hypothetical protein